MKSITRNRWNLVRERIEAYLGERTSPKERAYRSKREALAEDLGMADVTLKGFLPAQRSKSKRTKSATLGLDKIRRLLAKQEFQDLISHFPELGPVTQQAVVFAEVQLEIDFEGFDITPGSRMARLPIGKEGKLRLTIRRIA